MCRIAQVYGIVSRARALIRCKGTFASLPFQINYCAIAIVACTRHGTNIRSCLKTGRGLKTCSSRQSGMVLDSVLLLCSFLRCGGACPWGYWAKATLNELTLSFTAVCPYQGQHITFAVQELLTV